GEKLQILGYQSPRGAVGKIDQHDGGPGLNPRWFQKTPGLGGPGIDSRRAAGDLGMTGGDPTLGTEAPVRFSDYFDPMYGDTHPSFGPDRPKYPFTSAEYRNAFFLGFVEGTDITPLRYHIIVEAVDTRGTDATGADTNGDGVDDGKADDVIDRRSYVVQVKIPDIRIDTTLLPAGRAGADYVASVKASGGVPPLTYVLEWVDGEPDLEATNGHPLHKEDLPGDLGFGLEMHSQDGTFMGIPRASGTVELTVAVTAAVLNPITQGDIAQFQENASTPGEFNGPHPLTGISGIHRTFQVNFDLPSAPVLSSGQLKAAADGFFHEDFLMGAGGVPLLDPSPLDHGDNWNASAADHNYDWAAMFEADGSYPHASRPGVAAGDMVDGLPNDLILQGDATVAQSGRIYGFAHDRGFHPVHFTQTDFFLGDAAGPDLAANRRTEPADVSLDVGPTKVVYARGLTTGESAAGTESGLADESNQMGVSSNVPLAGDYGILLGQSGFSPGFLAQMPAAVDILPVMLAHGGQDEHVSKEYPSISGFSPAEARKGYSRNFGSGSRAYTYNAYWYQSQPMPYQHLQQLFNWVQLPSQQRVFLWGETNVKQWSSGASSGAQSIRYQQLDPKGKRGILIVDPTTGEGWVPAILSNDTAAHGTQFGAEAVIQTGSTWKAANGDTPVRNFSYLYPYWKYTSYYKGGSFPNQVYGTIAENTRPDREALLQGTGSYLYSGYSYASVAGGPYRNSMGRSAVSVVASADGVWMATALPGPANGDAKFLLWRTDRMAIPATILGQDYVTALTGYDLDGTELAETQACIVALTDEDAGATTIDGDQSNLLPDSLMFVEDGLLFLVQGQFDFVFGFSLESGQLSSMNLPSVDADGGFYIPDQDKLRGYVVEMQQSAQFAFAGDKPDDGEEGPDVVAFVAGDNALTEELTDLTGQVRDGWGQIGNRTKDLYTLELPKTGDGLDLGLATLKNHTDASTNLQGDLLTPGRLGEQLDFLAVSPDGKYVGVVRDYGTGTYTFYYSFYGVYYYILDMSFGNYTTSSSTATYGVNDDVMIIAVDQAEDLDPGTSGKTGVQNVLYLGTRSMTNNGTAATGMPANAVSVNTFNARYRKITGLMFSQSMEADEERSLIVTYSGSQSYHPKHYAYYYYGLNPYFDYYRNSPNYSTATEMKARIQFLDDDGDAVGASSINSNAENMLKGLADIGKIGDDTAPFGDLHFGTYNSSTRDYSIKNQQAFWTTFTSENGSFVYFVSDQWKGRNYLVGFNITAGTIGGHAPFAPFHVHDKGVGLELIDVNSYPYESRFCAVPGSGIVCFMANDASAPANNSIDLEIYAFDANVGGMAEVLSSDVTPGTANSLNQMYLSANANCLVFQRSDWVGSESTYGSAASRSNLQGNNELCVVTNV
ncbi:MAG: hypothetical protein ACYSUN_06450, partial [Planctomycetota bacterium]